MIRVRHSLKRRLAGAGLLALLGLAYGWLARDPAPAAPVDVAAGDRAIAAAFQARRSGVVVEGAGVVERVLADDRDGSRHQRFILRLESGHTVLVSHNIDLAPRVPDLTAGERIAFRGQYEWNARGGVLHWTHHDPRGDRPGGWLQRGDATYR